METIGAIIAWAVFGLVIGAIARLLVPGRQPIGLLLTMALGIAGAFAGGFLAWLITGEQPHEGIWSWIAAIVGAVVLLAIYVAMAGRRTRTY